MKIAYAKFYICISFYPILFKVLARPFIQFYLKFKINRQNC